MKIMQLNIMAATAVSSIRFDKYDQNSRNAHNLNEIIL